MKTRNLIPLLAGCGLCLVQITGYAQPFKDHISKQFSLQKPAASTVVAIYNLLGSVKVEGYAGKQVIVEVDEVITAPNRADVETGKKEFKLGFEQNADTIMAYIDQPYHTKPHNGSWSSHTNDRETPYMVRLEFTVKVPNEVNLRISTVNNGEIDVKDVYGALKLNNVNGGISIANAKGVTDAHTINGNLTAGYLSVPPQASSYYTLNGKLQVTYPANFAANLQLKSMNGKFFTDFTDTEILPAQVVKTQDKKANGTTFKLNKTTQVRIGKGGNLF
ncbi:DUF4097 family beta strand repeat-containing protein [Mucilaginibacter paludis]|uniref:Adhesin domain-containing protein n=1 Tax=Mucilaginibacter paludis DSM 18603 TaxID=714943 RepID=H1Y5K7_9SPHI|nr:hypothetical protein [Mucilaginibacter paludis]EHQ29359.1 hypothetical protein Mucpa_5284 [Mucilaginibacter paludis DSM 18603]